MKKTYNWTDDHRYRSPNPAGILYTFTGIEFKDCILGFRQCTFLFATLKCIEFFNKICGSVHEICDSVHEICDSVHEIWDSSFKCRIHGISLNSQPALNVELDPGRSGVLPSGDT